MDVESQVALIGERRLPCVDADADSQLELIRPLVELERPLCRDGRPHSIFDVCERAEELVSAAVDFDPARFFHGGSEQTAMVAEQEAVAIAQPLHERRRLFDVGEEKGDSPARQVGHRDHLRSDIQPGSRHSRYSGLRYPSRIRGATAQLPKVGTAEHV